MIDFFIGVGSGVMFTFLTSYAFTRYMLAHPELWAPKVMHRMMKGTIVIPQNNLVEDLADDNLMRD